jgi:hypothetical protein
MAQRSRLTTGLSGVAGEYFVAGELSRRGYIATITLRNTRGIDVLAASGDASCSVGIQVKTNQSDSKRWVLNQKAEALSEDTLFYVFVNLNGLDGRPSYHVVPSAIVAEYCFRTHREWLNAPGRGGHQRQDSTMRVFSDHEDEYADRWELLGLKPAV